MPEWIGEARVGRGVCERRFALRCQGRDVPGLLWTPDPARTPRSPGAAALVLLGHGGSLHKATPYVVSLARRLVRHHGFAAAAIDGPVHGDRRADGGTDPAAVQADFRKAWRTPESVDAMVADWRATLAALRELPGLGDVAVGYWGLSMGTLYGLPFVAAEPQVEAAVLGLMGALGPTRERLREDAARVTVPVLFLVQWHDELIPRERALALFDALSSRDKRLHAHPGRHRDVPREEFAGSEAFLAERLSATAPPRSPTASPR